MIFNKRPEGVPSSEEQRKDKQEVNDERMEETVEAEAAEDVEAVEDAAQEGTEVEQEADGPEELKPRMGQKLEVEGVVYAIRGRNESGDLVGKREDEDLHRVFSEEEWERGVLVHEGRELAKEIEEEMPQAAQSYWEIECVDNEENNPGNAEEPPETWDI